MKITKAEKLPLLEKERRLYYVFLTRAKVGPCRSRNIRLTPMDPVATLTLMIFQPMKPAPSLV